MPRAKGTSFHFRQFAVAHDRCAMKVNTDSVVMGAMVARHCEEVNFNGSKVLDIGTGSGIIALMLAQKMQAEIDGIEINLDAYEQAAENFMHSTWSDKLKAHFGAFQEFSKRNEPGQYDLIVSNPPFFEPINLNKGRNKQIPAAERALARFDEALPFRDLVEGAAKLLSPQGFMFVIIPYKRAVELTTLAAEAGMFVHMECDIIYKINKTPGRMILRFGKNHHEFKRCELILHDENGVKTRDYSELTKDYYL